MDIFYGVEIIVFLGLCIWFSRKVKKQAQESLIFYFLFDFLFFVVLCRNFYQLCVIGSFKKYHFVRNYMEYVMGVCY